MENEYVFKERLSMTQLIELLGKWNDDHAGKIAVHVESKGVYKVDCFCVMNHNGMAELAVSYHPIEIENGNVFEFQSVQHIRPCTEFFDGRFII